MPVAVEAGRRGMLVKFSELVFTLGYGFAGCSKDFFVPGTNGVIISGNNQRR